MVLSLHKLPFVTAHFQFITAHFVRHCALKNALTDRRHAIAIPRFALSASRGKNGVIELH